jgi:large subunit ribosomal protein L22
VRLVVDQVRGQPALRALQLLEIMPQRAAREVWKVVKSAVANAENNFELDPDDLVIKRIYADDGPTLKRFKPRARGRVSPILHRSSHITVVVDEREV